MRSHVTRAGVVGVAFTLAACTGSGQDGEPSHSSAGSTETTSTSASVTNTPPLPLVTFDPCDVIEDALLTQFGLDPSSKTRNDSRIGKEDIVACNIMSKERAVGIIAQNTPWNAIPLEVPAEPMTINGREALYVPDALSDDSCALLMRTDFGAVIIDTFPRRGGDYGAGPSVHACDGIVDMAEAIEPLIGS